MLKKILTALLAMVLLISAVQPVQALNHSGKTPTAHGIDVSHHQGTIDWDRVAGQIDFAILRCGYGSNTTEQDDRQWKANVEACTRLKIPFGVYIYSYATTEAQAVSEARHVLRLLEGYSPSLPVYLDLEDDSILAKCDNAQILRNAKAFCDLIQEAGYEVGIYANTNWWTNYLTSAEYEKWDRWVARYAQQTGYGKHYSMWQYTSTGSVKGISGNVDMNYWYGDFPPACKHDYAYEVLVEPSCTIDGTGCYTCKKCEDTWQEKIPATGHKEQSRVTAPTCTEKGFTTYTCTACGISRRAEETAALGHWWNEGTVILPPTQTESGEMRYECLRCELTMTVTLPVLGAECENCPSAHFTDAPAPDNWAHKGIDYAVKNGLFQGMGENSFQPDTAMSRAMLVTVLWRYAEEPMEGENTFSDIKDAEWYAKAVAWAAHNNIVGGVGNGKFDPHGKITREQLATILYRYSKLQGLDVSKTAQLGNFPDGAKVSSYAADALSWAVAEGLIAGSKAENGTYLDPQGSATRAQVATILMRFIENIVK